MAKKKKLLAPVALINGGVHYASMVDDYFIFFDTIFYTEEEAKKHLNEEFTRPEEVKLIKFEIKIL